MKMGAGMGCVRGRPKWEMKVEWMGVVTACVRACEGFPFRGLRSADPIMAMQCMRSDLKYLKVSTNAVP